MAGTVAKLVYPHKVGPNGDGFHAANRKFTRNMEEDDILNQLSDSNFSRRADILEQLRSAARKNGGRLPFQDQKAIFRGFAMALADSDWDVRHQCIQLIHELIPHFDDDLDDCMGLVLPRLVPNMGDSKITVRRSVIQTLHVYMKHTYDIQQTFKAIVQYGLDNQQVRVRKEVIIALPMMFTPEFNGEDFYDITQSLAKKLLDNSGDDSIQQHALLSLDKIRKLVGDSTFNSYLQKLSPPLRKYYSKLSGREIDISYSTSSNNQKSDIASFSPGESVAFTQSVDNYTGNDSSSTRIHIPTSGNKYEYGVIPSHIMEKLNDQSNFRSRAEAVEELKLLLKEMSEASVGKMSPHVLPFINFLNSLLEDSNFKITTVTLEILGLLVQRHGPSMKTHLKPLVLALTKRMGDNKIVIRQVIMKVVMQLMQVLSPKYVLAAICENLAHRNSRVRQETLNIVIASLLTFPSYDFDLSELCDTVAHTLVDPKRQVRQAALECYAVIASNLGAGKLQPLVSSVDAVELSFDGDGVMAAVQARLARRILPKLNADGLVDYATPVPSSAGSRGGSVSLPPGADIEWILSASGVTGGSARSVRSDLEIESVVSSARTTPLPQDSPSHGPTPRRSAGRGKGRLPWEDADLSQENGYNSQSSRQHPRQIQIINSSPSSRDQSPEPGSYRQMYLQQKQKKQNSDGSNQPFSVYNPNKDEESHSAFSTPRNTDDSSRMTFSNSWPDDPGKSNKRLLEPIADNDEQGQDNSPIPTKAALARGTSSRSSSKRKVPPIPVGEKKNAERRDHDSKDSARDSALDDGFDETDVHDEPTFGSFKQKHMANSLRQIRNSATRKKVDKIFEVLDKEHKKIHHEPRSPSPHDMESGIYSNASTTRSGIDETDHAKPTPNKRGLPSVSESGEYSLKNANLQALPSIATSGGDSQPLDKNGKNSYDSLGKNRHSLQVKKHDIDDIPCKGLPTYPCSEVSETIVDNNNISTEEILDANKTVAVLNVDEIPCSGSSGYSYLEKDCETYKNKSKGLKDGKKLKVESGGTEKAMYNAQSVAAVHNNKKPSKSDIIPGSVSSGYNHHKTSEFKERNSKAKKDVFVTKVKTPVLQVTNKDNPLVSPCTLMPHPRKGYSSESLSNGYVSPYALKPQSPYALKPHPPKEKRPATLLSRKKKLIPAIPVEEKDSQDDEIKKKEPAESKKSLLSTVSNVLKYGFRKKVLPAIAKVSAIGKDKSAKQCKVATNMSDYVLNDRYKRTGSLNDNLQVQSNSQIKQHSGSMGNVNKLDEAPSVDMFKLQTYLSDQITIMENSGIVNAKDALSALRSSLPTVLKLFRHEKLDIDEASSEIEVSDKGLCQGGQTSSQPTVEYNEVSVVSLQKKELSRLNKKLSQQRNKNSQSLSQIGSRTPETCGTNAIEIVDSESMWRDGSSQSLSPPVCYTPESEVDIVIKPEETQKRPGKKMGNVIIPKGTKAFEIRKSLAKETLEKFETAQNKIQANLKPKNSESIFSNRTNHKHYTPRSEPTVRTAKKIINELPPGLKKVKANYNSVYSQKNLNVGRKQSIKKDDVQPKGKKPKQNDLAGKENKVTSLEKFNKKTEINGKKISDKINRTKKKESCKDFKEHELTNPLCSCLSKAQHDSSKSDPFSPALRKKRLDAYLNDSLSIPRLSHLYNQYKEGQISVCVEHMFVTDTTQSDSGLVDSKKRETGRVQSGNNKSESGLSRPTKMLNGELHEIITDTKDGQPFKYLRKVLAADNKRQLASPTENGKAKNCVSAKCHKSEAKKYVSDQCHNREVKNCVSDKCPRSKKVKNCVSDKCRKERIIPKDPSGIRISIRKAVAQYNDDNLQRGSSSCETELKTNACECNNSISEEEENGKSGYKKWKTKFDVHLADLADEKDIQCQGPEEHDDMKTMKKVDLPFETKPRLVRKPTQPSKADQGPVKALKGHGSSTNVLVSNSVAQLDFSPHGGVTFKENPGLNLQMVGMGYGDDSHPNESGSKITHPHPTQPAKTRDRRRITKGLVASTSYSSMSSDDSNEIMGNGVFDGQVANTNEPAINTPPDHTRRERRISRGPVSTSTQPDQQDQKQQHMLVGVYGVGVRQNSIDRYEENEYENEEFEDTKAIAISQATRATLQMKVQQKKDEAERVRVERENQKQRELDEKKRKQEIEMQREKERQQLKLRKLAAEQQEQDVLGLAVSGSGSGTQQQNYNGQPASYAAAPKPPPTKPVGNTTPATKRKLKPAEERSPKLGSAKSSSEPENPENLKPFKEPQRALDEALKGMNQDQEWDLKCAALNNIRRLALHHPAVLSSGNAHTLNLALIAEAKNLRSQVSRLAIICLGEMFVHVKKNMEPDLDVIAAVLLAKAGETNNFIKDDTDQALHNMVDNLAPQRAMAAIITAGASHRSPAVRKTSSYFLVPICEKMGPGRLLSGVKDVTDKIFPVAANFIQDSQPETRHNGQKLFYMLMSHEDFDKMLNKHLPQNTLRNVSDKLDSLKKKGLTEPPVENGSAKMRRSAYGSRVNSSVRYHSATTGSGHDSTPNSSKHRSALPRTDEATVEDIKGYCAMMMASDWRERQNGITEMAKMVENSPVVVGANIVKIFDKFVPCLKDSNSKVNLFALQTMDEIAKDIAEYIQTVISYTIQTVASNLSSKNKDIYEAACNVLDTFMDVLDATILLQPFCNQAQGGNSRIKPDMVERVAYLASTVYPNRPRQVVLHVMPLLFHLLGTVSQSGATPGGTVNIRQATNHLVHALYAQMKEGLVEQCKTNSSVTPRMTQCLQDMIDNPAPSAD